MIKLHQFKDNLGVPNPSPFCMKVETYLRMAGLEYEVVLVLDPRKAPKGKAPHVEDDGKTIADSHFILDHLERKYHTGIDDHLSAQEKSIAHAFARMLEERFYWGLMYNRWVDERGWPTVREAFFGHMPPVVRTLVPAMIRRAIVKTLHDHGLGRHTPSEIYGLMREDIDEVAAFLADRPYFMGEKPSSIDCIVSAFMANIVQVPLDSPARDAARSHQNLVEYCDRMRQAYFSDFKPS